jgi:anthranilate/para-aminobenzoate synthase component II
LYAAVLLRIVSDITAARYASSAQVSHAINEITNDSAVTANGISHQPSSIVISPTPLRPTSCPAFHLLAIAFNLPRQYLGRIRMAVKLTFYGRPAFSIAKYISIHVPPLAYCVIICSTTSDDELALMATVITNSTYRVSPVALAASSVSAMDFNPSFV